MNRREFLVTSSALAAGTRIFGADAESTSRYRIGYTSNTRGGWEKDPFVGFREAHEVGFNWIEHFASSLDAFYPDKAPELKKRLDEIGVGVCAITGGRRGGDAFRRSSQSAGSDRKPSRRDPFQQEVRRRSPEDQHGLAASHGHD